MQHFDFSCRCWAPCTFAGVSICTWVCASDPESIFTYANRCFVSLLRGRGQTLPSSSHLLPLSPFASICSSVPCGWHLHPSGGAEESGHLTKWSPLRLEMQREQTLQEEGNEDEGQIEKTTERGRLLLQIRIMSGWICVRVLLWLGFRISWLNYQISKLLLLDIKAEKQTGECDTSTSPSVPVPISFKSRRQMGGWGG